jgi:outer membrane protein assembly factor BamB
MGHLHCLDAAGGQVLWKRDLNEEYQIRRESKDDDRMPIWGIAASPLIFNDLLILHIGGRDGACLVALDKTSGREVWRALDDRAQYSSPILVRQAGRDVLVAWTGDSVAGVDPRTGHVHWRFPFAPSQMPIGIATPIVKDDLLFVTSFYDGSLLLRLRQDTLDVEPVWQARGPDEEQTEALHSIISTPIWLGDYIYGVDSYGELRCLEAATGGRVWEDLTATTNIRWGTIHFVQNGEDTWMFNDRGELIIARLSPTGFQPLSRAKLLDPTTDQLPRRDGVCWSHPAFADGHVFARNDNELVCADLRQH